MRFDNDCSGVLLGNGVWASASPFEIARARDLGFVDCNSIATVYSTTRTRALS